MKADRPPVGIDFGMTNSLLTFLDPETKSPTEFKSEASDGIAIPTVVINPDEPNLFKRLWGRVAHRHETAQRGREFKLQLVDVGRYKHPAGWSRHTAYTCTKAFLESLLNEYVGYSKPKGRELGRIAMAVPDSWMSGPDSVAIKVLAQIFNELPYDRPEFISEPVAAGCYFTYCQSKSGEPPFDGHVLVYDHGGGTLDLSVLRIDGTNIEVIASEGLSRDLFQRHGARASDEFAAIVTQHGFGGVAFDNAVYELVAKRHERLHKMNGARKNRWLIAFENEKRYCSKTFNQYLVDRRDDTAFTVEEEDEVLLSDLLQVFRDHFAEPIREGVKKVLSDAQALCPIDTSSAGSFRIVAVGGFSRFPMVEQLLADCLCDGRVDHPVLKSGLPGQDKWEAVAKGACLAASGVVNLNRTCPYTFGIVYYEADSDQRRFRPLMREGDPQSDYHRENFADVEFRPRAFGPPRGSLTFYRQRSNEGKVIMPMNEEFNETLPDHKTAKHWKLCCLIENGVVVVRVRSNRGTSKDIKMGTILALRDADGEELF